MIVRMKCLALLAVLFAALPAVSAQELWEELRQPAGPVADFAGIIPAAEEDRLTSFLLLAQLGTQTSFVVVTLPDLAGGEIDDFTNRLYEKWGIGDADTDQGVLLLVSVGDRKIRIETGYGTEGVITDSIASRLIGSTLAPAFRQGAYAAGIETAMRELVGLVAEDQGVEIGGAIPPRTGRGDGGSGWTLLLFFLVFGGIMATNVSRHAGRSHHRGRGAYWGGPIVGGGFGGGRGGFGGGGGFGGFGGGMSGGGGASGGW